METGRNSINKCRLSAVRYFDTYIDKSVVADAGSVVVSGTCNPAVTSSLVTVTVYVCSSDHNPNSTNSDQGTGIQTLTVSTTGTNLTYSWRRRNSII
jgi:hypothetical protein